MSDAHESAQERLDALLKEGKITAEEYRNLRQALHSESSSAGQPAQPEGKASLLERGAASAGISTRDLIVLLICYGFQILGVVGIIISNPILIALCGFASIVSYLLRPNKQNKFVNRLGLIAAICGGVLIVFTILASA
jgi:hypothetical protein